MVKRDIEPDAAAALRRATASRCSATRRWRSGCCPARSARTACSPATTSARTIRASRIANREKVARLMDEIAPDRRGAWRDARRRSSSPGRCSSPASPSRSAARAIRTRRRENARAGRIRLSADEIEPDQRGSHAPSDRSRRLTATRNRPSDQRRLRGRRTSKPCPNRETQNLDKIRRDGAFDVIVVGGGINGIGVFRELALQGLRVLLVERNDFCSGCSAAPRA